MHIFRASKSLTSVWRGTASVAPVSGFSQSECERPSRLSTQPWTRRCRSSAARFIAQMVSRGAAGYGNGLSLRIRRHSSKTVREPIFQDERDGICEILTRLLLRPPLSVCTGDFGAVSDEPVAVSFENRGEFVFQDHTSQFICLLDATSKSHQKKTLASDGPPSIVESVQGSWPPCTLARGEGAGPATRHSSGPSLPSRVQPAEAPLKYVLVRRDVYWLDFYWLDFPQRPHRIPTSLTA